MLLAYESRHVGDITVVTCRGSIAEGGELAALQRYVDDSLRETPHIVADVGAVDFIDSCGVGFLVRLHTKAQRAGGGLRLCALPARIAEVLRVTHVATILGIYGTQAEAIAACYEAAPSSSSDSLVGLQPDILCIDGSPNVLAYVRELLKGAGFRVLTVTNVPDALVLATATRPKLVIISAALRSSSGAFTSSSEGSRTLSVIELPPEFSKDEAGHAARDLLERVRSAMAARG